MICNVQVVTCTQKLLLQVVIFDDLGVILRWCVVYFENCVNAVS